MKRDLTDNEIHELFANEHYGHLACSEGPQKPYLVPVTYAYHENALYGYSFTGKKIDIMRKNPHVCFQVERLHEPAGWRSAVVWGTYEELSGKDRDQAMSLILENLWQETNRNHPLFMPFRHSAKALEESKDEKSVVIYRIAMGERTGRMETYE